MSKIVRVDWEDACSNTGYYDKEHPDKEHALVLCSTVGYLKRKTKKHIILVVEKYDTGEERHIHTIPRKCVTGIKILEG